VLARTGHLGLVSRPHEFSRIVGQFIDGTTGRADGPHADWLPGQSTIEARHAH
jgi:hypothetical protein